MAKLRIIRCKQSGGQFVQMSGAANIFEVPINPASFSRKYKTRFNGVAADTPIGRSKPVPKYDRSDPQQVSFDLTLDGTGVVPGTEGVAISDQIEKLRRIAYSYDGNEHEPNPVEIDWGAGLKGFQGRLQALDIDYVLFTADGTPLRATIKMTFIEALTEEIEAKESNNKSPDLTHVLMVREGDTLPLMCQRIYNDASKYLSIARANDLDGFRALEPGTLLRFPPMR